MPERTLRQCFKCGGLRVYRGRDAEPQTLPDGSTVMVSDFMCLDCGARLFNYAWTVSPESFTGPSYLDESAESGA